MDADNCKPKKFTLPAKTPLEDLIAKYGDVYDISVMYSEDAKLKYLVEKLIRASRSGDNDNKVSQVAANSKNITFRRRAPRKQNNQEDEEEKGEEVVSDCVILSETSTSKFKAPLRATRSTAPEIKLIPIMKRTAKRKRSPEIDDTAKPGTLASRQKIPPPTKHRSNRDAQSNCELIDTNGRVNSNMMVSLQELCQRGKIKNVPDDPTDLLRKFTLIIPKLSETLISEDPPRGPERLQL